MSSLMKESYDEYFYAYNMLKGPLKSDDIDEGISKTLYLAKLYLDINDIIIYKYDTANNQYVHIFNQSLMEKSSELITDAINNKLQKDTLKYNYKYHDYKYSINKNGIEELIIIPIQSKNYDYLVAINSKKENKLNDKFMPIFKDVLTIILDKYDYITKLKESAVIDTLTGLYNRNIYEIDTRKTNDTEGIVYGLFDLLRLKNINDDYSHSHGDLYISKAAKILSNYFPSYHLIIDEKGKVKKIESGNRLYRIGGDEFALISRNESYETIKEKVNRIKKEVEEADIGVNEPIGINFGIVIGDKNKTFKELTIDADNLLSEDKRETYKRLGLERRRR